MSCSYCCVVFHVHLSRPTGLGLGCLSATSVDCEDSQSSVCTVPYRPWQLHEGVHHLSKLSPDEPSTAVLGDSTLADCCGCALLAVQAQDPALLELREAAIEGYRAGRGPRGELTT
jgi:hypothetical protein